MLNSLLWNKNIVSKPKHGAETWIIGKDKANTFFARKMIFGGKQQGNQERVKLKYLENSRNYCKKQH